MAAAPLAPPGSYAYDSDLILLTGYFALGTILSLIALLFELFLSARQRMYKFFFFQNQDDQ